jgi:hypothetical protein
MTVNHHQEEFRIQGDSRPAGTGTLSALLRKPVPSTYLAESKKFNSASAPPFNRKPVLCFPGRHHGLRLRICLTRVGGKIHKSKPDHIRSSGEVG